jgi:hypothetical protein
MVQTTMIDVYKLSEQGSLKALQTATEQENIFQSLMILYTIMLFSQKSVQSD